MHFIPPSAEALEKLKTDLGFSSTQMAQLFGLSSGRQWRKYTSNTDRRDMGMHMLFFAMARLELDETTIKRVIDRMRTTGSEVDIHVDQSM
ncbi:XRE family transcriptional regulator [Burkholderia vietnamiensis]|uniref:XRE family transcriptional regulator n=1 Tax=Burkholderia vietnamiensis TaxID=60552 RepID=UPI001BA0DCFF|nr:XRE family transcriptional regulator [Burkholderia vietnamiensis]MBR8228106.1 XRE family transcriptional regulator [Burkholderia vietnamiensis]